MPLVLFRPNLNCIFIVSLRKKQSALNSTNKTAILVFARSAQQDAQQKGLANGDRLFDALTKETLQKVERTGIPFFHSTEMEQQGDTFGARFIHAIQDVFSKGFDSVITVGNDSPQLKTKHLVLAQEHLDHGNSVLGPSLDGGIYLMGLHRSQFDAHRFLELPWQELDLFKRLVQLVQTTTATVYELPVLADIDALNDFVRLGNFVKSVAARLLSLLHLFVLSIFWKPTRKLGDTISGFSISLQNKGSPLNFLLG